MKDSISEKIGHEVVIEYEGEDGMVRGPLLEANQDWLVVEGFAASEIWIPRERVIGVVVMVKE